MIIINIMRKNYTKYTEKEWEDIRKDYHENNLTKHQITEKYNVSVNDRNKNLKYKTKFPIIPGDRYNMFTVVSETEDRLYNNGRKRKQVIVQCDCGNIVTKLWLRIKNKHTKSCGCMVDAHHESSTYNGGKATTLYSTWLSMKSRCNNPNASGYEDYGGRGIKVCDRWMEKHGGYTNFKEDMGERPEGTSIDRINNDGNYEPNNCKWSTNSEQRKNQRPRWYLR